jgi:hypothetical protein
MRSILNGMSRIWIGPLRKELQDVTGCCWWQSCTCSWGGAAKSYWRVVSSGVQRFSMTSFRERWQHKRLEIRRKRRIQTRLTQITQQSPCRRKNRRKRSKTSLHLPSQISNDQSRPHNAQTWPRRGDKPLMSLRPRKTKMGRLRRSRRRFGRRPPRLPQYQKPSPLEACQR